MLVATDTDAGEFERLDQARGRARRDRGDPHAWSGRLRCGADVRSRSSSTRSGPQLEIARLEELRLAATEQRIEAELELGHHAELVPELEKLVADHPLREQLRGQLMVALYRSGRHADALDVYRRGRQVLQDELGLEPSPFLVELERQILSHDPALTAPVRRFLPVGTVTFLFTDIEGSTRLLKQLGEQATATYSPSTSRSSETPSSGARDARSTTRETRSSSPLPAPSQRLQLPSSPSVRSPSTSGRRADGYVFAWVSTQVSPQSARSATSGWACTGRRGSARSDTADRCCSRTPRANWSRTRSAASPCGLLGAYRLKDIDRPEPLFQLDIDGLETEFPPLDAERVSEPHTLRRRSVARRRGRRRPRRSRCGRDRRCGTRWITRTRCCRTASSGSTPSR